MATGLENLKIFQMASKLEIEVHNLTNEFPRDERFRSVDQLRRSSSSVTNNISESYNKNSIKDKIRILNDIAKCEAEETRRNLEMCFKKKFHTNSKIIDEYIELIMAISGFIRFLKTSDLKLKT